MTLANALPSELICALDIGGDGLRVVVKDCIDIAGYVTACGSLAFQKQTPAQVHAEVVDQLLNNGCRIVGKSKMHELAFGMTGVNAALGTPINPNWPDRIPGGSSSGSAVSVAAGGCDFSIGTDTGGSVRLPAICCGVFGIKPTFGRVSRQGCTPRNSSLDCVGVFAGSADMLTTGMLAIDSTFEKVTLDQEPRLAALEGPCETSIQVMFDALFPEEDRVTLPSLDAAFDAGMVVINTETHAAFSHLLGADSVLGPDVAKRLALGGEVSETARTDAEAVRSQFTREVDQALATYDALVSPALPIVPLKLVDANDPSKLLPMSRFIRPFNLSGHPAIVLPVRVGSEGLPAGIQIVGRKGEDAKLCAIAEHLVSRFPNTFSSHSQEDC